MRLVLQRVVRAAVTVDGESIAEIARGMLLLVGIEKGDGETQVARAAAKVTSLRLFEDGDGRMNLDAATVGAEFLVVSQFTLAGSVEKGRRPSFDSAAGREVAEPLVKALVDDLRSRGFAVRTGRFGAHMQVDLSNDGPVTFVLDFH